MKNWILLILVLNVIPCFAQLDNPDNWQLYQSVEKVQATAETATEIWLGTPHGLVILDKNTLEKEIFNIHNSNLPAENIEAIEFDANGTPFIGTYDYVVAMKANDEWITIEVPIDIDVLSNGEAPLLYDLEIETDGTMWVATNNGLWRKKDDEWTVFNEKTPGFCSTFFSEVWEVGIAENGTVYFISFALMRLEGDEVTTLIDDNQLASFYAGGELLFNNNKVFVSNEFSFFAEIEGDSLLINETANANFPGNFNSFHWAFDAANQLNLLFADGEQYIYENIDFTPVVNNLTEAISTSVDQYFYDSQQRQYASSGLDLYQLNGTELNTVFLNDIPMTSNSYKKFAETSDGRIFMVDGFKNLLSFTENDGWTTHELPDLGATFNIYSLTIDHQDRMWLGTQLGLLTWDGENWTLLNDTNSDYPYSTAGEIATSISGHIYVAAGTGVAHFDGENWEQLTATNSGLTEGNTYNIATNDAGHLWITRDNVVNFYDGETWTYFDETNANLPAYIPVGKILPLQYDNVWMTGNGGLFHFDGTDWQFFGADEGLLSTARDFSIDSEGKIWAATSSGIGVFDGENWTTVATDNSLLVNNYITRILATSAGVIWISTQGQGTMTYNQQLVLADFTPEKTLEKLTVFPNPTSDFLQLEIGANFEKNVIFEIFDANGKSVKKGKTTNKQLIINNLNNGNYFIKLRNGQQTAIGRFTVVR